MYECVVCVNEYVCVCVLGCQIKSLQIPKPRLKKSQYPLFSKIQFPRFNYFHDVKYPISTVTITSIHMSDNTYL